MDRRSSGAPEPPSARRSRAEVAAGCRETRTTQRQPCKTAKQLRGPFRRHENENSPKKKND